MPMPPGWQMNSSTIFCLLVILAAVIVTLLIAGVYACLVVTIAIAAIAICAGPQHAAIGGVVLAAIAALMHPR